MLASVSRTSFQTRSSAQSTKNKACLSAVICLFCHSKRNNLKILAETSTHFEVAAMQKCSNNVSVLGTCGISLTTMLVNVCFLSYSSL